MWPFRFRVTDAEVQVRLSPCVFRRVLLSDIESARVLSAGRWIRTRDYWTWNEHWTNFWPLRYVILERKTGWIRRFVINPLDADWFVADLRRHAPHLPPPPA